MSRKLKVAVVGGGLNGLACLKYCLEESFDVVCFEQHDAIGGTWYYSEELRPNQGAACFQSLTTNTAKDMMSFSDFPMPRRWPHFMPHYQYLEYLQKYVDHFDLRKHIRFNTRIEDVSPTADYDETGKWDVTTAANNEDPHTDTFDAVMICTGFLKTKNMPNVSGLKEFPGTVMHIKDYRVRDVFKDKSVLVIGNSYSAADGASDAGFVAKQVYLSIGRGTWLINRTPVGSRPGSFVSRLLRILLQYLPLSYYNSQLEQACNHTIHHATYGLGSSVPFLPDGASMISDVLPFHISTGRVLVKPTLLGFDNQTAKFSDGSSVDVDMVMVATGFGSDYSFVSGCEQLPDMQGESPNHYKWIFPIEHAHHTLSFNGAVQSVGPHATWVELQAKLATRVFAKKNKLPPKDVMLKDVKYRISRQGNQSRFRILSPDYMDELAKELGVYPSFWSLFIRSPLVALRVFLTPHISVHYRLIGPGCADWAWKESDAAYWRMNDAK